MGRSLAQHHGKCDVLLASSSVRLLESQLSSLVSQNPGRCGDVYVTIEGGEALADIAKRIAKRPLVDIVPIIRSGGASSGEFGFPLPSRPKGVSESLWDRLADSRLPVGDTARAAAEIVYASLIETHSLDETEVTDIKVHGK